MSESSAPLKSCPQCGTSLPSDATAGLCPRCILAQAMQPPAAVAEDLTGLDVTVRVAAPVSSGTIRQEVELPLPEELTNLLPHGNYSVESFLGQGGMGAVYKGTQVRLKRPVAIKIMRRALGKDYDFEQRFEREAQAMAKLNHPNIVSVIDYGEAGPDYLYIVMELIVGADMMDVIRGGLMTQEMALSLLPQICDALQFAHDHGIVHRDIKPSNIMLTKDGRIKMADFGLAKRFDVESSFRTQTGTGMGTPDYAAPEQFDPTSSIDHRADIYALGVMIYQMITGQLPRGVWKPPSQRAEVAPQWDAIVSRAMQSDPSDRYQQASEVKTDVSSIPLAATKTSAEKSAESAAPAVPVPASPDKSKSKTPLLLGLIGTALVVSIGAFFVLPKKPDTVRSVESPALSASPRSSGNSSAHYFENAESLPKKEGVRWESGAIRIDSAAVTIPKVTARDAVLRASVLMNADSKNPVLALRRSATRYNTEYQASIEPGKGQAALYVVEDNVGRLLGKWSLPKQYAPSEWAKLEFRITGTQLSLSVDGVLVGTVDDRTLRGPGSAQIYAHEKGYFSNIEFESLDGKSLPSTIATWQPLFTDAQWRESGDQHEIKDGLLHLHGGFRKTQPSPDGAIRARVVYRQDSQGAGLAVRHSESLGEYQLGVSRTGVYLSSTLRGIGAAGNLGLYAFPSPLQPGDATTLELRMQGDHLIGLVNGVAVIDKKDDQIKGPGEWGIGSVDGWFESVEVLSFPATPTNNGLAGNPTTIKPYIVGEDKRTAGELPRGVWVPLKFDLARKDQWYTTLPNGGIKPITGTYLTGLVAKDVALRMRVLRPATIQQSSVQMRLESRGSRDLVIRDKAALLRHHLSAGVSDSKPISLQDGVGVKSPVLLECATIGDMTYGAVNHIPLPPLQLTTELIAAGRIRIDSAETEFTDIEIMILDGVPADKHPDFVRSANKTPATVTPNVPASSSSTQFPPGQWVKLFTKAEDLPEEVQKPGWEVKWKDGWITGLKIGQVIPLPVTLRRNYAVRLTSVCKGDVLNGEGIVVRRQEPADAAARGHYQGKLSASSFLIQQMVGGSYQTLHTSVSPDGPRPGKDYKLEMGVVGLRLAGRLNSDFATAMMEPQFKDGRAYLSFLNPIRDIEVINLNGLPEAEALRILGVDEKGNDLRGKSGTASPSSATAAAPFINTLGMKFVPVPETHVSFCVHETRKKDYAAYAAANPGVDDQWKSASKDGAPVSEGDDYPVCCVSWPEANAFCAWLSKKEGRAYRLPTDREWSFAVGVGTDESATSGMTPAMLSGKVAGRYPWGSDWPPPSGAGNFNDLTFQSKFPTLPVIEGYTDDYATTSPVMTFKPNQLGLYDLAGNVWEWCADLWDSTSSERVIRGGAWNSSGRGDLNSSGRSHNDPSWRVFTGFRCVLDMPAP